MKEKLADTRPGGPLSRSNMEVSKENNFRLVIRRPSEGLRLLSYLLTKFYARGQKLEADEEVTLDLVLEYFRTLRNAQFSEKIFCPNSPVGTLFSLSRLWLTFRDSEMPPWAQNQKNILIKSKFLLSPRAFLSEMNQIVIKNFIKLNNNRLRRSPRPPRRIGVGYRDKGTASISSLDGTPSWQTIGSTLKTDPPSFEERRIEMLRVYTFEALQPFQKSWEKAGVV